VVDTLFATATVGAAVFAAVVAALQTEGVRIAGQADGGSAGQRTLDSGGMGSRVDREPTRSEDE
jgi:hypothetical protein